MDGEMEGGDGWLTTGQKFAVDLVRRKGAESTMRLRMLYTERRAQARMGGLAFCYETNLYLGEKGYITSFAHYSRSVLHYELPYILTTIIHIEGGKMQVFGRMT